MVSNAGKGLLAAAWALFIVFLCCYRFEESTTSDPVFFDGFDKLTHTGLFFVFATLLFFAVREKQGWRSYLLHGIITLVCCAVLGGGIELIQKYIFTYRSAEWWDFGCDMLGSCMATFTYLLLGWKEQERIRNN